MGGFFGCCHTTSSGGGTTTPGGANTDIQYNNAGAFGGDGNLTWNKVTQQIRVITPLGISSGIVVQGDPSGAPIIEWDDLAGASRWYALASGAWQVFSVDNAGNPVDVAIQFTQGAGHNISQALLLAGGGARTLGINSDGSVTLNGSVGTAGQVPVSGGSGAAAAWGGAGSQGVTAGVYVSNTLAAGATDNLNPAPIGPPIWPATYGRLDLDSTAGAANITGLVAGTDGQILFIRVKPGGNNVTLNNLNAGSSANNQFSTIADLILAPGAGVTAVYYAGAVNKWVLFT